MMLVKVQRAGGPTVRVTDETARVLSLEYEDDEKKADKLSLTIDNFDLANFDDPIWAKGNTVFATWGYPGVMAPERECVIEKVTGFQTLAVTAYAKSMLMNRVTRTRVFENTTRAQVVRTIAAEHGWGTTAQRIDDTEEVFTTITQSRMTDAQFLRHLAHQEGCEFFVDFDGLHWHPRRLDQAPIRVWTFYVDPGRGDILGEPQLESDVTAKPGRVRVRGRDPRRRQDVTGEASDSTDRRQTRTAATLEVIDPEAGSSSIRRLVGSSETRGTSAQSDAQATTEARARRRRAAQSAIKMSIPLIGDPTLVGKSIVELRGFGRRLSGRWYVRTVKHKVEPGGYTMEAKVSTDGTNAAATRSGDGLPDVTTEGQVNRRAARTEGPTPIERVDGESGRTSVQFTRVGRER